MSDAEKEMALQDLHGRLQARLGAGFNPAEIVVIIDAILSLFKNVCPSPGPPSPAPGPPVSSLQQTCRDALEGRALLPRLRFRRELRAHRVPFRDIPAAMEAGFSVGAEASDNDVGRVYGCVE